MGSESNIFFGTHYKTYEFPKRNHPNQSVTLLTSKEETALYSLGEDLDLEIIQLESRAAGVRLFKGSTGVDIEDLPRFTKSKKCKCKTPKEVVVRRGKPEQVYYCRKCGGFVREWGQCRTKRK